MEMKTSTAGVLVQYGWHGIQYENRKAQNIQKEEKKNFIPRLIKVLFKVESQECD